MLNLLTDLPHILTRRHPQRSRKIKPKSNLEVKKTACPSLTQFCEVTEADVLKLIMSGNYKSCSLDPVPTTLLKKLMPVLFTPINNIINKSITEKNMPAQLKQAIVKPLLKKASLDKENLKNYRPVSNLPFISKIIEKVAVKQVEKHLSKYSLHEPLQSAYKLNHSVETALLKVSNDILMALDKRQCVYLVLLDLSAAFDTIDHSVFLSRLEEDNAITGNALKWMESYLHNRSQNICINERKSNNIHLDYGFPQGSVVGPFGFKLYTKPLTQIAEKHGINIHLYADDTQLYVPFDPANSEPALSC